MISARVSIFSGRTACQALEYVSWLCDKAEVTWIFRLNQFIYGLRH